MAKSFASLSLRIQNIGKYLNSNLEKDEGFYIDGVVMFAKKVSVMEKARKSTFYESHQTAKSLLD
jgi:hypothetical protein